MTIKLRKLLRGLGISIVIIVSTVILFLLTFTLLGIRRESKVNMDAAPPEGRFVTAGDLQFYIQEFGPADGKVIVFIGGTGGWSGFWKNTSSEISKLGYRTIAIDIPPFGFSEKPMNDTYSNNDQAYRITELLKTLKIKRATFVGHSFGGGATVESVLLNPDMVEALILVDAGGLNINLQKNHADNSSSIISKFLELKSLRNSVIWSTGTNPLFTKFLLTKMLYSPLSATDEAVAELQKPLSVKGFTNSAGNWLNYVLTKTKPTLTSDTDNYKLLKIPVLIIWGDNDTVIPISEGQTLNKIIPKSEMVVMKNVNHIPHLEDQKTFVSLITNFLSKNNIK